jgi:hypothetical protein
MCNVALLMYNVDVICTFDVVGCLYNVGGIHLWYGCSDVYRSSYSVDGLGCWCIV